MTGAGLTSKPPSTAFPSFPSLFTEKDRNRIDYLTKQRSAMLDVYGQKFSQQAWAKVNPIEKVARTFLSGTLFEPLAKAVSPSDWGFDWGMVPATAQARLAETEDTLQDLVRKKQVNDILPSIMDTMRALALTNADIITNVDQLNSYFKLDQLGFNDKEKEWVAGFAQSLMAANPQQLISGEPWGMRPITQEEIDELAKEPQFAEVSHIMSTVAFSKTGEDIAAALQMAFPPQVADSLDTRRDTILKAYTAKLRQLGIDVPEGQSVEEAGKKLFEEMSKQGVPLVLSSPEMVGPILAYLKPDNKLYIEDKPIGGYDPDTGKIFPLGPLNETVIANPQQQETAIKNIWDALALSTVSALNQTRQGLLSMWQSAIALGERRAGASMETPPGRTDEVSQWFREQYINNEDQFNAWVQQHPEMQPQVSWQGGSARFKDPWFYAYVIASQAPQIATALGAGITVTAATGNPVLGGIAGAAIVTPMQIGSVKQDLVANGADPANADLLATSIGTLISSIEILPDMIGLAAINPLLMKVFKRELGRELAAQTVQNLSAKMILKTAGKIEISETLEEVVQQSIQNAAVKTINSDRSLFEGLGETAIQTAIATLPLSVFGAGSEYLTYKSYLPKATQDQINAQVATFMNAGLDQQTAETITISRIMDTDVGMAQIESAIEQAESNPSVQMPELPTPVPTPPTIKPAPPIQETKTPAEQVAEATQPKPTPQPAREMAPKKPTTPREVATEEISKLQKKLDQVLADLQINVSSYTTQQGKILKAVNAIERNEATKLTEALSQRIDQLTRRRDSLIKSIETRRKAKEALPSEEPVPTPKTTLKRTKRTAAPPVKIVQQATAPLTPTTPEEQWTAMDYKARADWAEKAGYKRSIANWNWTSPNLTEGMKAQLVNTRPGIPQATQPTEAEQVEQLTEARGQAPEITQDMVDAAIARGVDPDYARTKMDAVEGAKYLQELEDQGPIAQQAPTVTVNPADTYYRGYNPSDSARRNIPYYTKSVEEARNYGSTIERVNINPKNPFVAETMVDAAEKLGVIADYDKVIATDPVAASNVVTDAAKAKGYDAIVSEGGSWVQTIDPAIVSKVTEGGLAGLSPEQEIQAVLDGRKPIAAGQTGIFEAANKGKLPDTMESTTIGSRDYVYLKANKEIASKSIQRLEELTAKLQSNLPVDESTAIHKEIGSIYGYSEAEVNDFLARLKFNAEQTFVAQQWDEHTDQRSAMARKAGIAQTATTLDFMSLNEVQQQRLMEANAPTEQSVAAELPVTTPPDNIGIDQRTKLLDFTKELENREVALNANRSLEGHFYTDPKLKATQQFTHQAWDANDEAARKRTLKKVNLPAALASKDWGDLTRTQQAIITTNQMGSNSIHISRAAEMATFIHYGRILQEKTGLPFYDIILRLRANYGIGRRHYMDALKSIGQNPVLKEAIENKESLQRVEQEIEAKHHDAAPDKVPDVAHPADLTDTEKELVKVIEDLFQSYQPIVRYLRIMRTGDMTKDSADILKQFKEEFPNAPEDQLRLAITAKQTGDVQKVWELSQAVHWGVIESGYLPHIRKVVNLYPNVANMDTTRGEGRLMARQVQEYDPESGEKTILQRLATYIKQVEAQWTLRDDLEQLGNMWSLVADKIDNSGVVQNNLQSFSREVQSMPLESNVLSTIGGRIWRQAMTTVFWHPWMALRNSLQFIAMYPDRSELVRLWANGNKLRSPTLKNVFGLYYDNFVSQLEGISTAFLYKSEKGIPGFNWLNKFLDNFNLYGASDNFSRLQTFKAALQKADRATQRYIKNGNIDQWIRTSGAEHLTLTERNKALSYLAETTSIRNMGVPGLQEITGYDMASLFVSHEITDLTNNVYERPFRGVVEFGHYGRSVANLLVFPRGYVQRLYLGFDQAFKQGTVWNSKTADAFKDVVMLFVAGEVVSRWLQMVAGKRRKAYTPFDALNWEVGGMALGSFNDALKVFNDLATAYAPGQDPSTAKAAVQALVTDFSTASKEVIPLYRFGLDIVEAITDTKNIDKVGIRKLRSLLDSNYTPAEIDDMNRSLWEKFQKAIFGGERLDPTKLEKAIVNITDSENRLGELKGNGDFYTVEDLANVIANNIGDFPDEVISQSNGFSDLVDFYTECKPVWDEYAKLPSDPSKIRQQWRLDNPEYEAILLFWGKSQRSVYTRGSAEWTEVRTLLRSWFDQYAITPRMYPKFADWKLSLE